MRHIWRRAGVVFLAVWLLTACSGLLKKPEIELVSVELAAISLVEQRFALKVNVRNPNPVDLVFKRLDFSVELDGRLFA